MRRKSRVFWTDTALWLEMEGFMIIIIHWKDFVVYCNIFSNLMQFIKNIWQHFSSIVAFIFLVFSFSHFEKGKMLSCVSWKANEYR